MLVTFSQYKHEEVQFDDNRTTGESQTEDTVNPDSEDYFGADMDDMDVETWETIEYEGDPIQRRVVTLDGVTAVSVPSDASGGDDSALPGRTLQFRLGGDTQRVDQAEIVEIQDDGPQ
ncbi:hypothetical protein [Natrinema caseinilyticum]|uniref:hypothetical protein n=1 Tax=Natrinema caseinilyticum TaxID=2961570 RepID=UPI0020C4CFCA|nr:hypothetical protein [Natrinema caseinilyticum]